MKKILITMCICYVYMYCHVNKNSHVIFIKSLTNVVLGEGRRMHLYSNTSGYCGIYVLLALVAKY